MSRERLPAGGLSARDWRAHCRAEAETRLAKPKTPGLRNPFGLAVEPETGRLFASVNARDDLGDAEPADSIVLVRKGRDFGWPDCWPSLIQFIARSNQTSVQ